MKGLPRALLLVLLVLSGCSQMVSANPQESIALPQYYLKLISYDGPSVGAYLSGWVIMEVDLPNSRMRLLSKRTQAPPNTPPYDSEGLSKAILDVPWQQLSNPESKALQELIHAWLETSPPTDYNYKSPASMAGWPHRTTITVSSPSMTVTSAVDCGYDDPPHSKDTGALRNMMYRLYHHANLWAKGTQPDSAPDAVGPRR